MNELLIDRINGIVLKFYGLTEIYSQFAKGDDSLRIVKIIETLPDSLWVESKCNCDPTFCPEY